MSIDLVGLEREIGKMKIMSWVMHQGDTLLFEYYKTKNKPKASEN